MTPEEAAHLFATYRDPETGTIPPGIRHRELAYVRTLPRISEGRTRQGGGPAFEWAEVGPNDRAGRTRALALDLDDAQTILAGGVSGGLWKSTDGGASWALRTIPGEHLSVTALAQDPRPAQRDTWYYAGGEFRGGTSAGDRGFRAPYYGAGVYKSTDNGDTWSLLPASVDPNPTALDSPFDYVHDIVVSPTTGTVFLATNVTGIHRSDDGGASLPLSLGGFLEHAWSEVAVGPDGTLLAALSTLTISNNPPSNPPGLYRSDDDGVTWAEITPPDFPATHNRSEIVFAPSNPNVAYVLVYTGQSGPNFDEDIRLLKLDLTTGIADDRSANLPDYTHTGVIPQLGAQVVTFGSFCMALAVKPDDEDFVIVGGTSLFRSTDGFATPLPDPETTIVGGYYFPAGISLYPNHYVDQHVVLFDPADPNRMWSANDGGVFVADDARASTLAWTPRNVGYNTAKFYSAHLPYRLGDSRVIGGTQDDGFLFFADVSPAFGGDFPAVRKVTLGDGAYGYFGETYFFQSKTTGEVHRHPYTGPGGLDIGPEGADFRPPSSALRFINPLAVDPNDEDILFFPEGNGNRIWRNNAAQSANPAGAWQVLSSLSAPAGYWFSALTFARTPAHRLYYAASSFSAPARLYRLEEANTATSGAVDISVPGLPSGAYIHSIAVNPSDGDELLVVASNYNIVGLYHSTDAGATYTAVEGNLTGTMQTPGPSLRSAAILPLLDLGGNSTVYLIGTSAGVFSTRALSGMSTVWAQEAFEQTGNVVVEYVDARPMDGRVALGTQGRGLFVGDLDPATVAADPGAGPTQRVTLEVPWPNPAQTEATIRFAVAGSAPVSLMLFDARGRAVREVLRSERYPPGRHTVRVDVRGLAGGTYLIRLQAGGQTVSRTLSVVR